MKRFYVFTALMLLIVASAAPAFAQMDQQWWNWSSDHSQGGSTVISISGVEYAGPGGVITDYKVPEIADSKIQGGILHFTYVGTWSVRDRGAAVQVWELGIFMNCGAGGTTACGGYIPLGWIHRHILPISGTGCADCLDWQLDYRRWSGALGFGDPTTVGWGSARDEAGWWNWATTVSADGALITPREIVEIVSAHLGWGVTQASLDAVFGSETPDAEVEATP